MQDVRDDACPEGEVLCAHAVSAAAADATLCLAGEAVVSVCVLVEARGWVAGALA